ncbi:MAG: hypothetical protein AUH44_01605 [Chloroflexi bacterium 13_1_40CM_68_15]|nr:MAG: hypothetical protein AUH44_01605 [Chloroflexi bacterium 13_1_40CM_68_15]
MRFAAAFALTAIAAASCARSSPPATAHATASQAVRSAPQKVILQASDVPADYLLETDDAMSPQQLADGLSTSTKTLEQRGASGYVRAFKQPDQQFRCCLIDSILITTTDANAARAVFVDFRASALALGSTETDLGEKVGDDSRVLVFQQPTADGDLTTMTVLFRYANVVDAVEVTGRPGSFERFYVLDFARKQLARLRADLERT